MTDYTVRVQRIQYFAAQVSHQSEMTLFIDNVGPDCTKSQLLRWLDSSGFQDTYDYLYVPRCFHTRKSTGQMFINFFVMDVIDAFVEAVKASDFGAGRALRVQLSTTQGLEANMSRWVRARSRRIRDAEVLPYVRPLDGSGVAHPAEAVPAAAASPQCSEVPVPAAWTCLHGAALPGRPAGAPTSCDAARGGGPGAQATASSSFTSKATIKASGREVSSTKSRDGAGRPR
ncbi:unnamed protein product [Prorocentrum cordatum]|uniref:RRM domain-containing protein n=1 Tax=Prorocentrum cordatum TaxID=2364126 RepID=A0ABN9UMC4_9DINO|nr:unnamed protein product [Polarella glacialis]